MATPADPPPFSSVSAPMRQLLTQSERRPEDALVRHELAHCLLTWRKCIIKRIIAMTVILPHAVLPNASAATLLPSERHPVAARPVLPAPLLPPKLLRKTSCPPSRTGRRRSPSQEPFPCGNAFQSRPSHVGGGAPREARRRACGARQGRVPRLSRHRIDGRTQRAPHRGWSRRDGRRAEHHGRPALSVQPAPPLPGSCKAHARHSGLRARALSRVCGPCGRSARDRARQDRRDP